MTAPNYRLDGRVALITGAASGIGRAIAAGVAGSGAAVALFDRPGPGLESARDEIAELDEATAVIAVEGDVTHPDTLTAAVRRVEIELGPLTLAVNSAGIADAAAAEGMALEQWRRVVEVDYTGVFSSCQAEARAMLRHGRGSIVNIASMSGLIVNRGLLQAHYNSAKAGVIHLSKSLAMEWAERGVRVNSVSPGYTATPMNTRPEVADQVRRFEADTPLGRMARVEEIVGPVVFLLGDAASFCTGVDVVVDGGFVCW